MRRILFLFVLLGLAGCCACPTPPWYNPKNGSLSLPTVSGAAAPVSDVQANHESAHVK